MIHRVDDILCTGCSLSRVAMMTLKSSKPVAMIRNFIWHWASCTDWARGWTTSGAETAGHIQRLVVHIRRNWPNTHITIHSEGHYGRP